jgi:peptide/nickel transport system substrate-binding protein
MNERDLRDLIGRVKAGGLSRRKFLQRMATAGLAAPLAAQLLAQSGVAMAQSRPIYKPTKRGGGGPLKLILWQGPTLLNPHFAGGNKDREATRLFYEPLAGWDGDGNLRPVLAEAIPGREDGTLAADGKSVTWKLKKGVTGTTASRSRRTTSSSPGSTRRIRRPRPSRTEPIGTSWSRRSTLTRSS